MILEYRVNEDLSRATRQFYLNRYSIEKESLQETGLSEYQNDVDLCISEMGFDRL